MEDWFHCNTCLYKPTTRDNRQFALSCCGHIFCSSCVKKISKESCPICKKSRYQLRPISAKVTDFQWNHLVCLQRNYSKRCEQLEKRFDEFEKKNLGERRNLERLVHVLRGENTLLREMVKKHDMNMKSSPLRRMMMNSPTNSQNDKYRHEQSMDEDYKGSITNIRRSGGKEGNIFGEDFSVGDLTSPKSMKSGKRSFPGDNLLSAFSESKRVAEDRAISSPDLRLGSAGAAASLMPLLTPSRCPPPTNIVFSPLT